MDDAAFEAFMWDAWDDTPNVFENVDAMLAFLEQSYEPDESLRFFMEHE